MSRCLHHNKAEPFCTETVWVSARQGQQSEALSVGACHRGAFLSPLKSHRDPLPLGQFLQFLARLAFANDD